MQTNIKCIFLKKLLFVLIFDYKYQSMLKKLYVIDFYTYSKNIFKYLTI